MSSMRILPTKIHGALDYLVGIALILAPTIFGFSAMGGAEVWIPRALGVVLIVYSVFTNYEWGVIKVLDMRYHLVVDLLASLFLAASPFIFGFSGETSSHWLPHVVVGLVVVLVVLVSQTAPGYGGATAQGSAHPA
jgi:SPW repeat